MQFGFSDPWWQQLTEVLPPLSVTVASEPTVWDRINAFSTLVVAILATVEVSRAWAESRARMRAAEARVSAVAYAVRRQLISWLDQMTFDPTVLGITLGDYQAWLQSMQPHFGVAEARMAEIAERSADASPAIKNAVSRAYTRFYRAAHIVNEHLRHKHIPGAYRDAFSVHQILQKCVADLDAAITSDLKQAADVDAEIAPIRPPPPLEG